MSRPHHSLGPHAPNLVRACATTDAEHDVCIVVPQQWAARPQPSVGGSAPVRRPVGTPSPSIYLPAALHKEVPTELLISEHEISVTQDLRELQRARFRRDFLPHYHGRAMARLRFALPGVTNALLRHAVLQFLRGCPLSMLPDRGLSGLESRDDPPDPLVLAPDGTRFRPSTGEIVD